jgi:allantoin racemase
MRLVLINPNTTPAMTDLMLAEARKVASPGTELAGVTGRFGARYIASRAAAAIAGHAALDAYAEHGRDADVVVLACFGDPGLMALKEIAHQPVIGMAEAACFAAAALGGRFGIVTGGERWGPMLREFVAMIGLSDRLTVIRTVAPTGADIARDPDGALGLLADACEAAARDHGADSVILGGAGLAGLAARLATQVRVPLIDSVHCTIRAAEALGRAGLMKAQIGSFAATPAVETAGLGTALTGLMKCER